MGWEGEEGEAEAEGGKRTFQKESSASSVPCHCHGAEWYLTDVAGPGRFLLSGRGHQDDGEGLAVLGLHHHLEVQVLHVLPALVRFGFSGERADRPRQQVHITALIKH